MNETTQNLESEAKANDALKSEQSSDEKKNTGMNQETFDKGVDVGFAKGANKAKKELLESLGIDDLENAKQALEFKKEHEESQKSATEQLETLKTQNKELLEGLKEYKSRDTHEAEAIFETLTEEQQASIKEANLPLERMIPIMKTLLANTPATKKDIGTPFSPDASNENSTVMGIKRFGADPEYLKDKQAFIQRKLEQVNRENK
jgi:hypothetical protein